MLEGVFEEIVGLIAGSRSQMPEADACEQQPHHHHSSSSSSSSSSSKRHLNKAAEAVAGPPGSG